MLQNENTSKQLGTSDPDTSPSRDDVDYLRLKTLLAKYGEESVLSFPDDGVGVRIANVFKGVQLIANFFPDNPLNPNTHPDVDAECYEMGRLVVKYFPVNTRGWVEYGLENIKGGVDQNHRQELAKNFSRWSRVFWESQSDLYEQALQLGVKFPWTKT